MNYTTEQIQEALRQGGADAVRDMITPKRKIIPITKRLVQTARYSANVSGTIVAELDRLYVSREYCDLKRGAIDLMAPVIINPKHPRQDGLVTVRARYRGEGYFLSEHYLCTNTFK